MSGRETQKQTMLERSVIGSLLMGDGVPSQLGLEETHFTDGLCARVFALMRRMEAAGKAVSLAEVCMADETLDVQRVVDLSQEHCVSTVILDQHCALLRMQSVRRAMETMLRQHLAELGAGAEPMAAMQSLRAQIDALSSRDEAAGEDMALMILDILNQFGQAQAPEGEPIACGIAPIDECLCGGFRPGDLIVIAALTSVGKSAMLSFMARSAASQGKRVLLISCEMSAVQNAERYLASISGMHLDRIIRREALTDEEGMRISDGMDAYHPEHIRVISSGTQCVSSVRREALRMKMTGGLDMIVVDYLQRMRPDGRNASRAEEVGSIAAGLKSMAVDLNVPVLTAAQFNREAAKGRSEFRGQEQAGIPALHQLRDSSQIEDEANTVIILDEPQREPGENVRRINAYVVKNRSGALKAARLHFYPQRMIYTEAK